MKELAKLDQLKELFLYSTKVTDLGLKELVALKQLRELNLEETKVTDEGVKELQKALPKSMIIK
jgi:Leucine-rich repeat (LRR) protein